MSTLMQKVEKIKTLLDFFLDRGFEVPADRDLDLSQNPVAQSLDDRDLANRAIKQVMGLTPADPLVTEAAVARFRNLSISTQDLDQLVVDGVDYEATWTEGHIKELVLKNGGSLVFRNPGLTVIDKVIKENGSRADYRADFVAEGRPGQAGAKGGAGQAGGRGQNGAGAECDCCGGLVRSHASGGGPGGQGGAGRDGGAGGPGQRAPAIGLELGDLSQADFLTVINVGGPGGPGGPGGDGGKGGDGGDGGRDRMCGAIPARGGNGGNGGDGGPGGLGGVGGKGGDGEHTLVHVSRSEDRDKIRRVGCAAAGGAGGQGGAAGNGGKAGSCNGRNTNPGAVSQGRPGSLGMTGKAGEPGQPGEVNVSYKRK